ncbi:YihY family inner membrane protein [Helicobacter enhydrae]|nr:YihY family inner membrane protein [Helicobacter enhydrae]
MIREFLAVILSKCKKVYGFLTHEDELFVYASSLSFYTIFAFIPLLLIVIFVLLLLPNFQEAYKEAENLILSSVLPAHSEMIADFLNPLLQNTSSIGMLGFVYVIFTSILFFRNYEYITSKMFNSSTRSFLNSLSTYWMLVSFCPIVLGVSFYFVFRYKAFLDSNLPVLDAITPILFAWLIFLVLFRISANKTLRLKALALSSFITSLGWNLAKWAFVYYISYNQSYRDIYGSIAFVLFSMLWIYVSWFVILLGMRLCEGFERKIQKLQLEVDNVR